MSDERRGPKNKNPNLKWEPPEIADHDHRRDPLSESRGVRLVSRPNRRRLARVLKMYSTILLYCGSHAHSLIILVSSLSDLGGPGNRSPDSASCDITIVFIQLIRSDG